MIKDARTPEDRALRAEAYAMRAALGGLILLLTAAADTMNGVSWAALLLGMLAIVAAAVLESVAEELRHEAEAGSR